VLVESERASLNFAPDPIHDLRVALRRCRSLATGYMAIDPDKDWKAMTRAARRLFRRLGEMRDAQVMEEWVRRLGVPEDPVTSALLTHLERIKPELESGVTKALEEFDRQKWGRWARRLRGRTRRIPIAGAVFKLSALGAWEDAYSLHKTALRNRSDRAWHRLRIGLKKFRYLVENFLPLQHEAWIGDLKEMQDSLGELHDLSVLLSLAARIRAFPDMQSRERWRRILSEEKAARLKKYREKMLGEAPLWQTWREGLPGPGRLQSMGLAVLQKWATLQSVNLVQVRAVRRLSLQIYDGLHPSRRSNPSTRTRRVALHAAAILRGFRDFGMGGDPVHETSGAWLDRLPPLPGFPIELLRLAATAARLSRAKLRDLGKVALAETGDEQRSDPVELAGILRLAASLAENSEPTIGILSAVRSGDCIIIEIRDYPEFGPLAEKVARARYLLEYSCRQPVLIRNLTVAAPPDSQLDPIGN
jgi:CHAD domain-containing protein